MEKIEDGGQAYPRACGQCGSDVPDMSKREAVAMGIMQGIRAAGSKERSDIVATAAFLDADAFLERAKKP